MITIWIQVPNHLKDAHYKAASKLGHGIGYKYAHNYDNHYVKLSTFDSDTIWQVVSVYTIKPESYYIRSIFSDYDFNEFLHTIKERSVFDFNYNYTLYDKILTLSTCDNGGKRRMVLHAKLVGILYK